ncbi:hypothetical protein HBA54_23000 [Pelagibius litoralis]|uniref:Uncharacterized protein n=1 Tax=Pelagibius litoralis TaxID=374515 RepID=A0A967F1Q2_9PROT|nr:hypothetical protein [Pelagibius litoralis]NIA71465.1 hypothetical protein [Pelagibius litoralis]
MNISRSTKMAQEFLAKRQPFQRKVQTYRKQFSAVPETIFPQLCPTREVDWIDGWVAELIYTTNGYAEPDCIFTTPESNVLGSGLWVFTRFEPNRIVELVVIHANNIVEHVRIELIDNGDGTCEGIWTLKFTAIGEDGNAVIEAMPDKDPDFDIVLDGLEHFLKTGERPEVAR